MRILAIFLLASALLAQQASLTGLVTDPTGAAIPAAGVTLRNVDTAVETRTETNSEGYYAFPLVPPGNYRLTAEAGGFKSVVRTGIRLAVEQKGAINLALEVGQVTERISVEAAAPLVSTEDASIGTIVDRRKLADLPLNGRNPLDLVTLAPGVTPNSRGPAASNVNGGRDNTSDVLLDGSSVTSTDQGDVLVSPPLEGVEEFKVQTASFGPEFGRAGGVVNVVTRGGTNEWHGSAFEFLRNDAFDANGFFSNATGQGKDRNRYHQYGGSFGGPLRIPKVYDGRNRTFFFFTPEYTRQRGRGLMQTNIPTELERAGDFSKSSATFGPQAIFDPATTRAAGNGFTRDVFPGNLVPRNRFNPIAVNIIEAAYPLPNFNGRASNFVAVSPATEFVDSYMSRIDHNFSSNHRLSGRYLTGDGQSRNPQPWPGRPTASQSGAANNASNGSSTANFVLRDTLTLKPTVLNEFVYGLQYFHNMLRPASANQGWAQKLGIKNAAPYLFPTVTISGYSGLQSGNLSDEFDVNHQFADNVTWIKGRHIVKAGVEWRRLYFANQQPAGATAGNFSFDTQPTRNPGLSGAAAGGLSFASLLLGVPSTATLSVNDLKFGAYWHYYGAFIQDKWKVNRKLTVEYGIRWEYTRPRKERWNRMSVFDLQTQTLRFAGENGTPETVFEGDFNNYAPRIGLAYAPTADGKTSIRSSFGLFYLPVNNLGALGYSKGFTASRTFPTVDGGLTFPLTLSEAFPVVPISKTLTPGEAVSTIGPKYPAGYDTQWTFSVQREIFAHTLADVSYVGMKGTHLALAGLNLNQVPAALLGPGNAQSRRPYPNWGDVTYGYPPIGNSIFHSLQFKVERRLTGGFSLLGSYALQKSIDNGSGTFAFRTVGTLSIQDNYNLRAERSISTFDRTHNVVLTGLYDLPFGKGKPLANHGGILSAVLGGWQLNAILRLRSGVPLSMATVQNLTGSLGGGSRPNRRRSGKLPDGQQSIDRWFDPAAFELPPQFQFGNTSRTEPDLRGPGTAGMDASLARVFRVAEKVSLQIRGEAFNALNRVNFGGPNATIGNRNAGIINSASDARSIQLGARLWF